MELRNTTFKGLLILGFLFFLGCKDDVSTEDLTAPQPLVNVNIINTAGGVDVSYDAPIDNNVSLITAEYGTDGGGREIKRFSVDQHETGFTLLGLTTTPRSLELYTVSYSGVRSEAVFVEIEPLLSPTMEYLQNVLVSIDFVGIPSGVAFNFDNPDSKELTFVVEVNDNNTWKNHSQFDIAEQSQLIALDDFSFEDYRIYVQYQDDVNLEKSGAKVGSAKAMEEIELNKGAWTVLDLPDDNYLGNYAGPNYAIGALWDNLLPPTTSPRFENKPLPLPHSFTVDLGDNQNYELSKIRIYPFANSLANAYGQYNPKTIEVWASNDPDSDGGWSNWTQLTTCVSKMPSGGPKNASDLTYIQAGEEFRFPLFTGAYRYLRFKVLDTWTMGVGETTFIRLSEVTLFGTISE